MTLLLRAMEDTVIFCIVGTGFPDEDTSEVVTRVLGHMIVPDLASDRSGSCSMFVKTVI